MQLVPLCCQSKHPIGSCFPSVSHLYAAMLIFPFHLSEYSQDCGSQSTHAWKVLLVEAGMLCPVKALWAGAVKRRPIAAVKLYGFLFFVCLSVSDIADDGLSLRFATSQYGSSELFKRHQNLSMHRSCVFQGCDEPTTVSVPRERLWKIDCLGKMRTRPTSICPWQACCWATCLWRLLKI